MFYAVLAQPLFAKTYGSAEDEHAWSIIQTTDGGYAIAGATRSFGAGLDDFLILKLDRYGDIEWTRSIGGPQRDLAYSLFQTSDGGYIVVGITYSFGTGDEDIMVIKLGSVGNLEWAKTYGGPDLDECYAGSLARTADDGCVFVGGTKSFGAGDVDIMVVKLGATGNIEWARTFGYQYRDFGYSVIQTGNGGYVVVGQTMGTAVGPGKVLVLRLSPSGDLEWSNMLSGPYTNEAFEVIQTSDGGYAIVGNTDIPGADLECMVIKLGSTGNLEWAKAIGGPDWDESYSIAQTPDGGYVVAGITLSYGPDDLFLFKLSATGELVWGRTFGGPSRDALAFLKRTGDGGFAITGYTESFGVGGRDIMVITVEPDGSYPDCVSDCAPYVEIHTLSVSSPSLGDLCSPITSDPNPSINTPNLTVSDVCVPLYASDLTPGREPRGIVCSHVAGGILFRSHAELAAEIYSPDGRLVYSGHLQKGENRIPLGQGVYLWQAGPYRGKAVVR